MRKLPQVCLLSVCGVLAGGLANAQVPNLDLPCVDDWPGEPGVPGEPSPTTLSWDPPTQNVDDSPLTDLAGYIIYFGRIPHALNGRIALDNPGLTRYVIQQLTFGTWYFAMAAVNLSGRESSMSEIVSKRIT
jgi:hypothetical protein